LLIGNEICISVTADNVSVLLSKLWGYKTVVHIFFKYPIQVVFMRHGKIAGQVQNIKEDS